MRFSHRRCTTPLLVACALLAPLTLYAQTPPRDTSATRDSTRRAALLRAAADTDSTHRANVLGIPGIDALPIQLNLRTEAKGERDRNLSCNTVENAQVNALTDNTGNYTASLASGFAPRFRVFSNLSHLNGRVTTGHVTHDVAIGVAGYTFKTYSDVTNPPAASVRLGTASIASPIVFALPPAGIRTCSCRA